MEQMEGQTDENGMPFKSLDEFVNYQRMNMHKEEITKQYKNKI